MFGIDFSELMVIAVVALIVIGPEHLPKVARTAGHLWGRLQRYVSSVKADMSREMALEDLRKVQREAQEAAAKLQQSFRNAGQEVEKTVSTATSEISSGGYGLGQSLPENEIGGQIHTREQIPESGKASGTQAAAAVTPRHEIIEEQPAMEEHHAVLPESIKPNRTTDS
jgi:sec-independent protein translocase protein TatB